MKALTYIIIATIGLLGAGFLHGFLQYFTPIMALLIIWLIYELDHAIEMPDDFDDKMGMT